MSVDAYLTLVQIGHGLHLVEERPHFVVREPVALVPVYHETFGPNHVNMSTRNDVVDSRVHLEQYPLVLFPSGGVVVVPADEIRDVFPEPYESPGGIPWDECERKWSEITPGVWVVMNYHVCGMGDDGGYYSAPPLPNEVEVRKVVKDLRFWT
jgi:hypothetical protein